MAFAFDSLGYAQRLRGAGIPQDQAEAHAEAAREFIMAELVTRNDIAVLRGDVDTFRRELEANIESVRRDLDTVRRDLEAKIETQTLRLTVRLGGMIALGIAALAALIKLA